MRVACIIRQIIFDVTLVEHQDELAGFRWRELWTESLRVALCRARLATPHHAPSGRASRRDRVTVRSDRGTPNRERRERAVASARRAASPAGPARGPVGSQWFIRAVLGLTLGGCQRAERRTKFAAIRRLGAGNTRKARQSHGPTEPLRWFHGSAEQIPEHCPVSARKRHEQLRRKFSIRAGQADKMWSNQWAGCGLSRTRGPRPTALAESRCGRPPVPRYPHTAGRPSPISIVAVSDEWTWPSRSFRDQCLRVLVACLANPGRSFQHVNRAASRSGPLKRRCTDNTQRRISRYENDAVMDRMARRLAARP